MLGNDKDKGMFWVMTRTKVCVGQWQGQRYVLGNDKDKGMCWAMTRTKVCVG